jgi:diguanylate cyclase (GGDEF)-like protein
MALFGKDKLKKIQAKKKSAVRHTIMLVDDEEGNLKSLASMFLDKYNLMLARDGQEALDQLQAMKHPEDVSLIISDQRMPGLTGIQLFERLIPIVPDTIRIIITGFTDISVIIESIDRAQIYKFIPKPYDPNELLLTVERAIQAFELKREADRYHRQLEQEVQDQARLLERTNSRLRGAYKKLEDAHLSDPLTGLWNHRYLRKFFADDAAQSRLLFLVMDVDRFKDVNHSHGRCAGDRVLKQLAVIVNQVCGPSDIPVRWGGPEFLVVHCVNRPDSQDRRDSDHLFAEEFRKAVEERPFHLENGRTVNLTCSIGFAAYPFLPTHPGTLDWQQVMDIAHLALDAAKKSGPNAWVGLQGSCKTKTANLFQRIRDNINALLTDGELIAPTSVPGKNPLMWR